MKEKIKKYKNGLLGVGIWFFYLLFSLLCEFFTRDKYVTNPFSSLNSFIDKVVIMQLPYFIFFFLMFQCVPKLWHEPYSVVSKPGDPFYENMAKERSNHFLWILVGTIILFFLGFLFFKGGPIENFLGDMVGVFFFFLGIIFLLAGSLKSVTLYRRTKDKKFLVFIFSFFIVLLAIYLYGTS